MTKMATLEEEEEEEEEEEGIKLAHQPSFLGSVLAGAFVPPVAPLVAVVLAAPVLAAVVFVAVPLAAGLAGVVVFLGGITFKCLDFVTVNVQPFYCQRS